MFKDLSYVESDADTDIRNTEIEVDEPAGRAYISDYRRNAVLVIDLETAEKVILSKSANYD